MANEKNLIYGNKLSRNEARENGKKGGIKSGESRRAKKAAKDYLKMILDLPITKDNIKKKLEELGIGEEYYTNEMLVTFNLFNLAASEGDLNAIKYIDERTGKNPQLKLKREELAIKKRELKLKEKSAENLNTAVRDTEPDMSGFTSEELRQLLKPRIEVKKDE